MFASWHGLRVRGGGIPGLVGRGVFVQSSRQADAESLGDCLLADRYKMDEKEVRTRWDEASLYNSIRKTNDELVMLVVRQLLVLGYSNNASFHSREAGIGIDLAFPASLIT